MTGSSLRARPRIEPTPELSISFDSCGPTCCRCNTQDHVPRLRRPSVQVSAVPRCASKQQAPPQTNARQPNARRIGWRVRPAWTACDANDGAPGYSFRRSSYTSTLRGVSNERVTVSLPDDVRRAAQRIAEERGTSFSAVVAEALTGWMRGRLVDTWLAEHQGRHGEFDEDELRALAADSGVPYVGPGRAGDSAA
jgi:predicted transcriptional regulator